MILGGGFAGIECLKLVEKKYSNHKNIDITIVSDNNFFLFTPMLPEVVSGDIETRHIATPIRKFCNKAIFYEAEIMQIDLDKKTVSISHNIGKQDSGIERRKHSLEYDYLVIALGGVTNFFGMEDIANNAFTLKNVSDAMILRNHIINMLEQAEIEYHDKELKNKLLTFVIVGGGFSGVETVGELNDFLIDSINEHYKKITTKDLRIILVEYASKILPEVPPELSDFTLKKLKENGVEVRLNTTVVGATNQLIKFQNAETISTFTIIWTGGIKTSPIISNLPCKHDQVGRLIVDKFLRLHDYENVFVIGDCASIINEITQKPFPPTAQIALKEAEIAVENITKYVNNRMKNNNKIHENDLKLKEFKYKSRGIMALIGRKNGVGIIFGRKIHGFVAWWIWHTYYLGRLPTTEKKIRVIVDWTIDLLFEKDVTRFKISK